MVDVARTSYFSDSNDILGCFYVWSLNSGLLVGSYVADSDAVNCVLVCVFNISLSIFILRHLFSFILINHLSQPVA
jgi:hypothetical protein